MELSITSDPVITHKKRKFTGLFIITLAFFGAILVAVFLTQENVDFNDLFSKERSKAVLSIQDKNENVNSVFEKKLAPIFSTPVKLIIKVINVETNIVPVGVVPDGTMETPKDWFVAGWYEKSAKPGEQKNLIINGHYDTNTGSRAVFWNISRLNMGDLIEVMDNYGRIYSYKVLELNYVDLLDPSRLDALKDEDGKSTLTLITCGGVWMPGNGYNKRLIVKAELLD